MEISVSGKLSRDVADDAMQIIAALQSAMERTGIEAIPTNLRGIVYFPMILSPDLGVAQKDNRSFSRSENAEFVNIGIPHESWISGTLEDRVHFIVEGLRSAILQTKETKIGRQAKAEFEKNLDEIGSIMIIQLRNAGIWSNRG